MSTPSASDPHSRPGRIAVLISGRGSNLRALLQAMVKHQWPMEVVTVVSNQSSAEGLEHARQHGIPTHVISHREHGSRQAFDRAVADLLLPMHLDLVVLAGFMRILSPEFCLAFEGRLINIHPSLLPSFKGLHTHQQALDAGVKVHGCTVHAVTAELDHGPILAQAVVPVLPGDDAQRLSERVLKAEHRLYPMAIAAVISGRLRWDRGQWQDDAPRFDHEFSPCLPVENP